MSEESLVYKQRHSLAHILAQAVQRAQQFDVEVGIGPAIDNGFYYDFLFSKGNELGEDKLKNVQEMMQKIIKENQEIIKVDASDEESHHLVNDIMGQQYKEEMRQEFISEGEKITFYCNVIREEAKDNLLRGIDANYIEYYSKVTSYLQEKYPDLFAGRFVVFLDMCEGPHVENTKEIDAKAFKLAKVAGAYWRGDEKNVMMSRIYGYAFEDKEALKNYIDFLEEAKKRDHRVLGQKLKLFTISPLVGAGLPLLQPNGMIIRQAIQDYLWDLHKDKGYSQVWTPHIAKQTLYETSGHWEKFGDELFKVHGKTEHFCMKPMNCPHHMQIFADNQFSYRDMPIRYFEPATVYRDELTGELSGLSRVRSITQDDGHLFCRISQIEEEVGKIIDVIKTFYGRLGMMDNYRVSLSVRGDDKSKYLGSDENRNNAESMLKNAAEVGGLNYKRMEGEAAFYGPKLDFMFKDSLGREWQLATIQCDFNLPERFNLSYINEDGDKERPVVIHRAISGSFERFMSIMIEHFAGAFPLWLAPEQMRIVPVADKFNDYALKVQAQLKAAGYRVKVDDSSDSFSKKIRNGEMMKVPYLLIVGEQEENKATVNVRDRDSKEQKEVSVEEFLKNISN